AARSSNWNRLDALARARRRDLFRHLVGRPLRRAAVGCKEPAGGWQSLAGERTRRTSAAATSAQGDRNDVDLRADPGAGLWRLVARLDPRRPHPGGAYPAAVLDSTNLLFAEHGPYPKTGFHFSGTMLKKNKRASLCSPVCRSDRLLVAKARAGGG